MLGAIFRKAGPMWKALFLTAFLGPIVLAAIVSLLPRNVYEASGWVLLDASRNSQLISSSGQDRPGSENIVYDQIVKSQLNVATSEDVIRAAIRSVSAPVLYPGLSSEDDAFLAAKANVNAVVEPNTYIIRLSFRHTDPKIAAEFANSLIASFLQKRAQLNATPGAASFFARQEARYSEELAKSYSELEAFSKATGAFSISEQRSLALARRDAAASSVALTHGQIRKAESELETIKLQLSTLRGRINLPPEIYGADPAKKTARPPESFGGDPSLLHIKLYQQLAEKLVSSNAELAGLKSLAEQQAADFQELDSQLQRIAASEAEFSTLRRKISQGEKYLESLSGKGADVAVNDDWRSAQGSSSAQVLQSAQTPLRAVFPRPSLFMALGFLVSIIGTGGLAYFFWPQLKAIAESPEDVYAEYDAEVRDIWGDLKIRRPFGLLRRS